MNHDGKFRNPKKKKLSNIKNIPKLSYLTLLFYPKKRFHKLQNIAEKTGKKPCKKTFNVHSCHETCDQIG